MAETAVDLITLSREFGSGGSELARELGTRLGWRVLDRDLVQLVADRLKLDPRTVETMDEHPPGLISRISSALLITSPESPISLQTRDLLSPDAVADATRAAITEAVQSPPLIVVGHGAQLLFRDRPGSLHVRLTAPVQSRIERICSREPCEPNAATTRLRHMDADRAAYVRRYYHADWRDPMLYDLAINTGRTSIKAAAAAILAVMGRTG